MSEANGSAEPLVDLSESRRTDK